MENAILIYTEMKSKVGNMTRSRPPFEPGLLAPKQLNLKSLAMQAGSNAVARRRSQKPNSDFQC